MRIFAKHLHSCDTPWADAPLWALELGVMDIVIITNQEKQMAQADDLNNAVTSLTTGFAALDTAVQAELVAIAAALNQAPNPVIAQAISNIGAITGKMATDAALLTASIPAATTVNVPPSPPPEVPVPPTPDIVPDIAKPPITAPDASAPSSPPPSAVTVP